MGKLKRALRLLRRIRKQFTGRLIFVFIVTGVILSAVQTGALSGQDKGKCPLKHMDIEDCHEECARMSLYTVGRFDFIEESDGNASPFAGKRNSIFGK